MNDRANVLTGGTTKKEKRMNVKDFRMIEKPATWFSRHELTENQRKLVFEVLRGDCGIRHDSREFQSYEEFAAAVEAANEISSAVFVVAPTEWCCRLVCDFIPFFMFVNMGKRGEKNTSDVWKVVEFNGGSFFEHATNGE